MNSDQPLRKFRVFLGKFETNGQIKTYDLSCLYDQTYSWRRNSDDYDRPEKGLTLKESCQFMNEILFAWPTPSEPPSNQALPMI